MGILITLCEQSIHPDDTPPGTVPMKLSATSGRSYRVGRLRFYLPQELLNPQEPHEQKLICGYIVRAREDADRQDSSKNLACSLISQTIANSWLPFPNSENCVKLTLLEGREWGRFDWATNQTSDDLKTLIDSYERVRQLKRVAEVSAQSVAHNTERKHKM